MDVRKGKTALDVPLLWTKTKKGWRPKNAEGTVSCWKSASVCDVMKSQEKDI